MTSLPSSELGVKQPSAVAGPLVPESGRGAPAVAVSDATTIKAIKPAAKFEMAGALGEEAAEPASSSKAATDSFIAVTTPGNTAYKIGPEDVVDISVFKVPELSKSVQVADGGTINLPLVGEIAAAGKTARDIELELTKTLGDKYLKSPQVTVFVKEYNSQRVTVEGSVKKPGVYPIRGKNSLLQLLASAGGLEEIADSGNILVVRQVSGKRYAGRFDLDAIRKGSAEDPQVQQGDVIIVNTSNAKAAFQTFMKIVPVANLFTLL
ncbi:MAG: polysaccharide biosynthesis/export family protein [Hyphomicrobiaceae bacterium]